MSTEKNSLTPEEHERFMDIMNDLEIQFRRAAVAGATYLVAGNVDEATKEARFLLEVQDNMAQCVKDYFDE